MAAALALDLGTSTGWALLRPDGRIESGVRSFEGGRDGQRFLRFRYWLHDTKRRVDLMGGGLDQVLYERVDFIKPGQVYSAHVWGGMWATLTAWCEHHGIDYGDGIAVSTLKKLATGNGFSPKPHVVAAVNKRMAVLQPTSAVVTDHNEADALALLLFARTQKRKAA